MPRNNTKKFKPRKAPLVEVDRLELTDKRLNPEEAVCREREELLKQASKFKIRGQAELEDPERSGGARLHYTEIIRRLKKCNSEIQIRDGSAGSVALYVQKHPHEYRPSDFDGPDRPKDDFFIHHKYCGGMLKQELSEWSHVTTDTSQVALHEVRGWRSVLISCIKAGAITYDAAIKHFGDPSFDQRSGRWFDQVGKYKRQ